VVGYSISGTNLSVGSPSQAVNMIVHLFGGTARCNKYP
jgi:hypothetical protein